MLEVDAMHGQGWGRRSATSLVAIVTNSVITALAADDPNDTRPRCPRVPRCGFGPNRHYARFSRAIGRIRKPHG